MTRFANVWKCRGGRRDGFLIPMVFLALLSIVSLVVVIHSMTSGYAGQVAHGDEVLRCRMIAESAFAEVLARMRDQTYENRFFKPRFEEFGKSLLGGEYDLFIEDTAGKPLQADVYIRASYRRAKRLFFWRFVHETTILDAVGRMLPIIFTSLDAEQFPNQTSGSPFTNEIEELIKSRKENDMPAKERAGKIKPLSTLREVMVVLNGPDGKEIEDAVDPAPSSVPPSTLSPPAQEKPIQKILEEDYENVPPGTLPPGWTPLSPSFPSPWTDSSGVSAGNADNGTQVFAVRGHNGFGRSQSRNISLGDSDKFTYEARLCLSDLGIGGPSSGGIGFIQKKMEPDGVRFGTPITNAVYFRDGRIEFLGKGSTLIGSFDSNKFVSVKVEIDFAQGAASVFIDGQLVADGLEPSPKDGDFPLTQFGIMGDNRFNQNDPNRPQMGRQEILLDDLKISKSGE